MILIRKKVATVFAMGVFCLSSIPASASKGAGSEELNAVANEFTGGRPSTILKSPPLGVLGAFNGQSEMPDKKEIEEAGLTQGEHFVLLAALDLCRTFLPDAQNFLPDTSGRVYGLRMSLTVDNICMTLCGAAEKAYGAGSKRYEVIKQGLNVINGRSEMPDEKEFQKAGLTQGEHFVLLTAVYLCQAFLPYDVWQERNVALTKRNMSWVFCRAAKDAYGVGSKQNMVLTKRNMSWVFCRAAKDAYGVGSKQYAVIKKQLGHKKVRLEFIKNELGLESWRWIWENPYPAEVQEAGLARGEQFVLLAAVYLHQFLPHDTLGVRYSGSNFPRPNERDILWSLRNAINSVWFSAESKLSESVS